MDPFASDSSEEEEVKTTTSTQEQKKNEIKNVFGDDSSDSEEEGEAPVKKRRRLSRKNDDKTKKKADDDGTSAYDKEKVEKETEEDRQFIDSEDDDEDLLSQYKYDQSFKEDEVDSQFDKDAAASKKGSKGIKVGKKRTKIEDLLTDQDKGNKAKEVLRTMEVAHHKDMEAHKSGKPMIHKFKVMKKAFAELQKQAYHQSYVEYNVCEIFSLWLQDLPDGNLCNKSIREAIYDLLFVLPVDEKQLMTCTIGKRLISIANHPDETMKNKVKIKKIVEKWMRPIFKKSSQYSKRMAREYEYRTVDKTGEDDDGDETKRKSKKKKKKASRDAIQNRLANQKREPRPGEPGFTWYAKVPEKMNLSGLKRIRKGKLAAKKTAKSKRQHEISRKLIKMKQKANSKSADLRPIKVSVQGRGL